MCLRSSQSRWHLAILLLEQACRAVAKTSIAGWEGLRGAQLQETLVLEGGLMTNGTFSNGKWSDTGIVQHSYGVYYQIDLTASFDATVQDTTEYLKAGLPETSNTQAPNYVAGGLFQNDYQFYTFGGLADKPPIDASTVTLFNVYPSNPSQTRFDQGVSPNQQTDGVSDNITSGAYASSPDQGLGFYFSGMVGATRGQLEYNSDDSADNHPTVTSPTFIKVDMTTPSVARFEDMTWPANMTPRAEGSLVWLPYGKKGILIAIGGVQVPGDRFIMPPEDTQNGPFMTELAIYDIDSDAWHVQQTLETTEQPSQLASFCTVVVPTQDGKSHEVFVYGGYDGTYTSTNPNVRDDVWVLSVPAFQWTKLGVKPAASGSSHARQGSVCFAPNPTTMITVGGTGQLGGALTSDTIIDVLDLNLLEWTGKYNATTNSSFNVPDAIVKQLNFPDAAGPGSTFMPSGLNNTLNNLFSTAYQGQVQTYYPYSSQPNSSSALVASEKGSNRWKLPVIATLCTVLPLAIIGLIGFWCWHRFRKHKQGTERTQRSRKNVFSWLGKSAHMDPEAEKSNSTDDTAVESNTAYFDQKGPDGKLHEAPSAVTSPGWMNAGTAAGSTERYEMGSDQPSRPRESISTATARSPQFSPRSVSQEHTTQSRFSEAFGSPQLTTGTGVTTYEMPSQKSEDDLLKDVTKRTEDQEGPVPSSAITNVSAPSQTGSTGSQPSTSPERPGHRRNMSSLSSDLPSLISPGEDEDLRRSRHIDVLPDIPASPQSPVGDDQVAMQHGNEEVDSTADAKPRHS